MLATREFRFLSLSFQAGTSIPWSGKPLPDSATPGFTVAALPKLWFYHLNYCDFVNLDLSRAEDTPLLASAFDIVLDWIRTNDRGNEIAWDSYPLSLRVVNWLKFLGRNSRAAQSVGRVPDIRKMAKSIADQASRLAGQMEEDLGGNHLLKNAKALLFAGAFLDSAESGCWWSQGSALLARELDEQVLTDGGHVERSPSYHCQVLEDLLDVEILTTGAAQPLACLRQLQAAITRMTLFLQAILHPDGRIPLLNDSAFGMATPARNLLWYAHVLEPAKHPVSRAGRRKQNGASVAGRSVGTDNEPAATATIFADTGYAMLRSREGSSFAILDCGPLGPDYQPGHGHCDLLSYEISLDGRRIVVDTGVSTYESGRERLYERSTAAHNTIRIDGEEQAEIWASFRVGRRPPAGCLESGDCESSLGRITWVRGQHFAYSHRGVIHTRTLAASSTNTWFVIDTVEGWGRHRVESFLHFHPSVELEGWPSQSHPEAATAGCGEEALKMFRPAYVLAHSGKRYVLEVSGARGTALGSSWYATRLGRRDRRPAICWMWEGELPVRLIYTFVPLAGATGRIGDLPAALLETTSSFPDSSPQPLFKRPPKQRRPHMNGLLHRSISPWFKHGAT